MKRYSPQCNDYQCANVSMEWDPAGKWVAHSAHVALLARIRAAVAAERGAMFLHVTGRGKDAPARLAESILACEALDALLSDGGV